MNKPDLILNNLQWLIYHKTKPNQYAKREWIVEQTGLSNNFIGWLIYRLTND